MGNRDSQDAATELYDIRMSGHELPIRFRAGLRDKTSYVLSERDYFLYYLFLYASNAGETELTMRRNGEISAQKAGAVSGPSGRRYDSPKRGSKTDSPKQGSKTDSPKQGSKTDSPKQGSKTDSARSGSKTDSPKRGSKTDSARSGSKTDSPKLDGKNENARRFLSPRSGSRIQQEGSRLQPEGSRLASPRTDVRPASVNAETGSRIQPRRLSAALEPTEKEKTRSSALPAVPLMIPRQLSGVKPEIFLPSALVMVVAKSGSVKIKNTRAAPLALYTSQHSKRSKAAALTFAREFLLSQDVETIWRAVANFLQTLPPDPAPVNYAINYHPSRASLLSIQLAVAISAQYNVLASWFSLPDTYLYPHEWKYLFDKGLDLLETAGPLDNQQLYLYWFIDCLHIEGLHESIYTVEDIVQALLSGSDPRGKVLYMFTENEKLRAEMTRQPNSRILTVYTALDRVILRCQSGKL